MTISSNILFRITVQDLSRLSLLSVNLFTLLCNVENEFCVFKQFVSFIFGEIMGILSAFHHVQLISSFLLVKLVPLGSYLIFYYQKSMLI